jgi:hypothetical protein
MIDPFSYLLAEDGAGLRLESGVGNLILESSVETGGGSTDAGLPPYVGLGFPFPI